VLGNPGLALFQIGAGVHSLHDSGNSYRVEIADWRLGF
jgi:hypothetical protein